MNQCDGCAVGMPLKDGKHYMGTHPEMVCTKDRYAKPPWTFLPVRKLPESRLPHPAMCPCEGCAMSGNV